MVAKMTMIEFVKTWLLREGADPNYSLWAASFNNDIAAIRLRVQFGAVVDHTSVSATPFLEAIGWSKFAAAKELLKLGADVNAQDAKGMTALHYMLKKGSDKQHFAAIVAAGAKGDIANKTGETARAILRRKKGADFRAMAERLK